MKKLIFFLFLIAASFYMNAQHLCQVHYGFQNTPNTLTYGFVGYAWNSDSSQISVTHWEWNFGDGGSATTQDPSHTYVRAGRYRVCLAIATSDGCTTQYCDSITIGTNPQTCQAVISHQAGNNNDIYFTGYASNNNGGTLPVLSYYWTFGDGTEATTQDPHHIYSHPGTYQVCLTIITTDSCTNTTCGTFTVGANTNNCAANYTYQNNPNSLTVYFLGHAWNTDSSQINVTAYNWSFGDGTTGTGIDPHHTYSVAGLYRVCMSVHTNTGCLVYFCDSLLVGQNPQINCTPTFIYARDSSNLSVLSYHFMGYSGNNLYNTTRWEWSFGDGTGSNTRDPQHTFAHAGWYNICVHVIDSVHQCYGGYCDSIHIGGQQNIPCLARFSFQANPQTSEVHFYGYDQNNPNNPQNITSIYWDFGDGTSATTRDPNHTYYHPGLYYVCVTITTNNNCTSTYCDSIEIRPNTQTGCQANWSAYLNTNVNCPYCFTFVDLSTGNNIVSREWVFDDGTVSHNRQVIHTFNHPGVYHICLTIRTADSCTSTYCNYLHVDSMGNGWNHCSVYLTNTTTPASNPGLADGAIDLTVHAGYPPYRFEWSNGARTEDISGLAPGYYTVEVHDSLNCGTYARIHVGRMHDSLGITIIDTLLNGAIDTCLNFQYQHVRVYNIHYINNTTMEVTWIFEGNGISSFITETYQVSQQGNYVVGISVHCGTKSLDTYYDIIFTSDLTGINNYSSNSGMMLFPNPVNDVLNIQINPSEKGVMKILLINSYGQIMLEESPYSGNGTYKIPMGNLSNGLYIVRAILDNNTILTAKFIK